MSRRAGTGVRLVGRVPGGRVGAAVDVPAPYVVLDLGRGRDPHQARCRRCRWRSGWRMTVAQAQAEYDRHQVAAHGRGRRTARRDRWRLVARRRAW